MSDKPKRMIWVKWFLERNITEFLAQFTTGAFGMGGIRYKVHEEIENAFDVNRKYIDHLESQLKEAEDIFLNMQVMLKNDQDSINEWLEK